MLFHSSLFLLIFLPLVLVAYYLLAGRRTARLGLLSIASLAFYGYWDVRFLPLLAGSVIANWLLVQWFAGRRSWRFLPLAGVALNLVVLGVFKYADFFAGSFAALGGQRHHGFDIVLPIGISFFTFQQISYLVDLKRGERRIYGFVEYSAFVTFFPQLIAGPIVRHHEIIGQFDADPRRIGMGENLSRGYVLLVIGLFKKVMLADHFARIADPLFARAATEGAEPLRWSETWVADVAFTLQIYFDFSGYSDMAIGLALMFGLRLPPNFEAPYRAVSVREFWRRWHMTLSRFLRDYVYIAFGGNRRGPQRQAVYLMLTMLLGGLWHGAAWTFVLWGGLHGAALVVNVAWHRLGFPMPRLFGWLLTVMFVTVAWVLFRADGFDAAWLMVTTMAGAYGFGIEVEVERLWLLAVGAAIVLLAPISQRFVSSFGRLPWWGAPASAAVFLIVLLMIGGAPHNEFIYFQF